MNSNTPTTPVIAPETKKPAEAASFNSFDKKAVETKTEHKTEHKSEEKNADKATPAKPAIDPAKKLN